ncbi:uncharacterized protein CTRU02_213232 [Colletotrichum truncatum]|uniref:Uncharacterized protein n=1 Tax=Colletotrichum truncatum TaxID=5467 RepID=A0ACC3YK90_COLTU
MGTRKVGYAEVASWMARDVDNETLIYRRFDELSIRNLLYMQSELASLEFQLNKLDEEDADPDEDIDWIDVACDWEEMEKLTNRAETQDSDDEDFVTKAQVRIKLIKEIREKLKEYHETLLLQSEIAKLKRPKKRVFEAFEAWFTKPPKLGGKAKKILDNPNDLVALNPAQEADYLSEYLRRHWRVKKEGDPQGVCVGRYEEKSITITVASISILTAATLLVGSIVGLYFVQNDAAKLGLIALFTALFALTVGFTTTARRAEIFAGTAAYAAVLVVFVSGDLSSSQKP